MPATTKTTIATPAANVNPAAMPTTGGTTATTEKPTNATATADKPSTTTNATATAAKPATKKGGGKTTGRKASKPKATTTAKPKAKASTAKKPGTEPGYINVLKHTPATAADAMNGNRIAKAMTDKRGKTVWPMPTKAWLEKGVTRATW